MGAFADWQPQYAERGIATFPVREKTPVVSNYLKIGIRASSQFALKFPSEVAFGLACRRNRITVLDVDAPDERLLADAMSERGPTPFVVRSGSGNFQAWYRHNGERRRVRPDPTRPIDILGDGFVVAPPSQGAKGAYAIINGHLDDLGSLPTMRAPRGSVVIPAATSPDRIQTGERNNQLWRECMIRARTCGDWPELMEAAMALNETLFYEALPADEVLTIVANAWKKESTGNNWFGSGGRVVFAAAEIDRLHSNPDAFFLLSVLKRHHWGTSTFVVANAMAETMPGGRWRRERFAKARTHLLDIREIEEVRPPIRGVGPALYRFKGAQK